MLKRQRIENEDVFACSTASLESLWVIDEIDKALEKERRIYTEKGRRVSVLIPLFLDGHIFEWVDGRATHLRSRLEGDFYDRHQPVKFREWIQASANFASRRRVNRGEAPRTENQ